MELIADGLMIATALTAGLYCMVLGRRLRRLNEAGGGIGAQIAALDASLAETRTALAETRSGVSELRGSTKDAAARLSEVLLQAEAVAARVERGIGEARTLLQRLYDAGDRLGSAGAPGGEAAAGREAAGQDADDMHSGNITGAAGTAGPARRQVALPGPDPDPAPAGLVVRGERGNAGSGVVTGSGASRVPQGGPLRAERVML